MNRNQSDDTKILSSGKVVYATSAPTIVETDLTDPVITVSDADRLDVLAFRYYGSAALWWVIAKANNIINGSLHVPAGTQLIIPAKNKIL